MNIVYVLLLGLFDILSLAFLLSFLRFVFLQEAGKNRLFIKLQSLSGIEQQNDFVIFTGLLLLLIFILKNYISYLIYRRHSLFVYGVASWFSRRQMEKYFRLGYQEYTQSDAGVQTRNISQVPVEFAHYVLLGFISLISETIILIFVVAGLLLYRADVLLLLFISLLPCIWITYRLGKKKTARIRGSIQKLSPLSLHYLYEGLESFIETKMHALEDFFVQRYAAKQKVLNEDLGEMVTLQYLPLRLLEVFAVTGVVLILIFQAGADALNPDTFIMLSVFLAASYKALPSLNKIMISWGQIKTYRFAIDALNEDAIKREEENLSVEAIVPLLFKNGIRLSNISFRYESREKPVLLNTDLFIPKGRVTGITGASGNGKTTLIKLLLLFIEPSEGTLSADDHVLGKKDVKRWRKGIAYVKQQPFILNASIAENIALGETIEHIQPLRLEQAIQTAGLGTFIKSLPGGVNTVITENGKNISGGQKQRLAIARALYLDCPLIILDESLNELEEKVVDEIGKTLEQVAKAGETVILVSHQQKVLKHCNNVYELSEGKAAEIHFNVS